MFPQSSELCWRCGEEVGSRLHHHEIPSKIYRKSIPPLLLTAAKSCIPLCWKQTQPPSVAIWLKKVAEIYAMEDLVAEERGLQEKFKTKWYYWCEFVYSEDHAEPMTQLS